MIVPPSLGGDGAIYFWDGVNTYCLNPDGSLRWRVGTSITIIAPPVVDLNGSSFWPGRDVIIARASDGTEAFRTDLPGLGKDAALVIPPDGTLLVKTENGIRKLGP